MRTFVQVLVLELDETEGDPTNWDWQEIIDTPGAVLAFPTVEIDSDPGDEQVDTMQFLTADYRGAVRDALGILEEVQS